MRRGRAILERKKPRMPTGIRGFHLIAEAVNYSFCELKARRIG